VSDDETLFDPVVGFGTAATLAGVPLHAIMDTGSDIALEAAVTDEPSARVLASQAPAAAPGQTLVVGAQSYKVRQVLHASPDGAVRRLVLARS